MGLDHEKLLELLSKAAAMQTAAEREAFLDSACRGNPELREQVDALLCAHDRAGNFLQARVELRQVPPADNYVGATIERYKLLRKLGEGGFGVVYLATQVEPVQRQVAFKIIKPGMDTREVVARFEAERQALALMDHPNIAKVLDAGTTENERPYFVMELVEGAPLTDYCDQNRLSTQQRLQLFIKVCHAVQHAHQKGIIHRDLKPSNVMVTVQDGEPVPKIIDFGVAKALGQKLTEKTLFTAFQQLVGTPAYMSPEQAELSGLDVDTRSDIYSLGVLLYELLTGVTPFDAETLRQAGLDEIRRIIRETEPAKPSTRLHTLGEKLPEVANRRHSDPLALSRLVRGDLDWIVMKCLEKDRRSRYETAESLAKDLLNHLNDEPVTAAAPTAFYRLGKAVRRHRFGVGAVLIIGLLLVAGIIGTTTQMLRAKLNAAREARATEELEANLYAADVFLAQSAIRAGDYGLAKRSLTAHLPGRGATDLRGFEWAYLWRFCQGDKLAAWKAHDETICTIAVSPDGALLVSTSADDQEAKLWDARSYDLLFSFHEADCAAFSPDNQLLFAAGRNGLVQIWELKTYRLLNSFSTGTTPWATPRAQLAVSPIDPLLAVCTDGNFFGGRGSIFLYDYRTGMRLRSLTNSGDRMVFSTDGKLLVTGSAGGILKVWELATGQVRSELRGVGEVASLALSPQNLLAATEFWSGDVRLWDLASGKELPPLRGHPVMAWQATFSPDGGMLASCSSDQKINLWDVANRKLVASMVGHESEVWSLAFSPDSKRLFSGSKDETIGVWPTKPDQRIQKVTVASTSESPPLFSPDGLMVAAGGGQGEAPLQVNLWDPATATLKLTLPDEKAALWFSADAKLLLTLSSNSQLHFWDLTSRTICQRVALSDNISARGRTVVSKDGRVAAGLILDSTGQLWIPRLYDVSSGACRGELRGMIRSVSALEFSPNGSSLAIGGDCILEFWDVGKGKLLHTGRAHKNGLLGVTFSPQGDILATCGTDNLVKLWSVPAGRMLDVLSGHREGVIWVAFSPDGKTLASACADGWVKLWHVRTRRELASFRHITMCRFVRFSPDSKTLAIAAGWGTMCLLRAPSLTEVDAQQQVE